MRDTPKGGAGSAGAASSDGKPVSIGTVLTQLREEFPEVTISKIRFLEAEGLVEPKRTPSGYRKFTQADVERLAAVLRMQRDHYLPLKVIREHLDALERGEQVPLPAPATPPGIWSRAYTTRVRSAPRLPGSAGPSCWPPRTWTRRRSPTGSRTDLSSPMRTADTTSRPSRWPNLSRTWVVSVWSRGICVP